MPKAAGLADALKKEFGVRAKFVEGSGGVFDVTADGELVFSKHEQDRFPEHDEIIRALKQKC